MNFSPYLSPGIPTDPKYWENDMDDIKELEFELPTAFNGAYLDVHCTVLMIEPGEIADIIVNRYYNTAGSGPMPELTVDELHDEVEKIALAVYEQHGDQIIECMNELF